MLGYLRYVNSLFTCLMTVFLLQACSGSQIRDGLSVLPGGVLPLDETTVVAGLKQALEVGTANAVARTSVPGGFSDNELIRIALPGPLGDLGKTLRSVGLGGEVEQMELLMNKAAESATTEAKGVFLDAVRGMTVTDAFNILNGGKNAATRYFQRNTEDSLRQRFAPIISSHMEKVGFYPDYKQLLDTYDRIPFTTKPDLSIENYVADKTIDGLFSMIAREEAKIRRDPAARTSELLQRVFGSQLR